MVIVDVPTAVMYAPAGTLALLIDCPTSSPTIDVGVTVVLAFVVLMVGDAAAATVADVLAAVVVICPRLKPPPNPTPSLKGPNG